MGDELNTVKVLCENGVTIDMDVPREGSNRREIFDEKVANRVWQIVEEDAPRAKKAAAAKPAAADVE